MAQTHTEFPASETADTNRLTLTGGEVIGRALSAYGVRYAAGIPGHGAWGMLDGLMQPGAEVPFIQVFHEQGAIHLADGYYRASGRPMAAFTSVGPGAANTVMGLATAFADSTSLVYFSGAPPTHMIGHGTMQELDRRHANDFAQLTRPVTKRQFTVDRVEQLPHTIHRAFNAMLTGRPGPVHIEVPMDVQALSAPVVIHDLERRLPHGLAHPDPDAIETAARVLNAAERPVIVVGGGAVTAEAAGAIRELAEALAIPVVTTWNGKGAFPEDHRLFAGAVGQTGTIPGNAIAASADVVVAIGCRFTDWSASSYRRGVSFSIPPAKLIHIDVDPYEIGKNYPAEVGVVADAGPASAALRDAVGSKPRVPPARGAFLSELDRLKTDWAAKEAQRLGSDQFPFTSQRPLRDLRRVLPRDGIIVVGSGNPQGAVKQSFPVYEPRTHLGSGSYSSMGWAVPASIGAKLAQPDRKVACVLGDGDFLMTLEEIGVCVTNNIPVVFIVQNNQGYMSIRGGQRKIFDRHIGSEFTRPDGSPYSPDFKAVGAAFGLESHRVDDPTSLEATLKRAIDSDEPVLVEVPTSRDAAGPWVPGWWDFPVPAYITDSRQDDYWSERSEEQHA
jgi:acetolactate synthase I/II/III large subunit